MRIGIEKLRQVYYNGGNKMAVRGCTDMEWMGQVLKRCGAAAVWLYLLVVVGWMPFYFTKGYGYIGTDKGVLYRNKAMPLLGLGILLLCVSALWQYIGVCRKQGIRASRKAFAEQLSFTDLWMIGYLFSVVCSYLASDYQYIALWGNASWPMGLVTLVCMVASYFVISRFFTGEKVFFGILLAQTTVVFGLGILNRYSVYPILMEYANPSFLSTVGNMNWFCGYWSVTAWLGVILYWEKAHAGGVWGPLGRAGLGFLAVIALALGIVQGSDSGILALAAVLAALFCFSVEDRGRLQRFLEILLMVCGICMTGFVVNRLFPGALNYETFFLKILTDSWFPWVAAVVCLGLYLYLQRWGKCLSFFSCRSKKCRKIFLILLAVLLGGYLCLVMFNTLLPEGLPGLSGKPLFTFNEAWGSKRGITWTAGVKVWESQDLLHKLTGVGPDSMGEYIYSAGEKELLQKMVEWFGNDRLYNAHGEWLTNLANLGLFGMVSFAGIMVSAFKRFCRAGTQNGLMYFFAVGVLAYTVNNIFSFQTMMNLPYIFIMLGVGEAFMRKFDVAKAT